MNALPEKLQTYDALLKKWQKTVNLVSNATLDNTTTRHFEDSLQILNHLPPQTKSLYDLGSGGGFPGLVIAAERPEINCTLIEASQKKCNFLTTVARELDLKNVTIYPRRIEDMVTILPPPDVITARALTNLTRLLELTQPWAENLKTIRYLLLKGETAQQEIDDASRHFDFQATCHASLTHNQGQLLDIRNIALRP